MDNQYELTLVLHSEAAEVAFLSGDFEEIVLTQLLQKMIKIAIENTGAQQGYFIAN